MSSSEESGDRAKRNPSPQPANTENGDLFREDSGKSKEAELLPEKADDKLEDDTSSQPLQIDREFIRRVIAPELELYWSRMYGRTLK